MPSALRTVTFEGLSLSTELCSFLQPLDGWDGEPFEAWRASWIGMWWDHLVTRTTTSPMAEWLEPWVSREAIARDGAGWVQFWTREVDPRRMPKHWLAWGVPVIQGTQTLTQGTPVDSQIALYLPDCEAFATSDKNFIRCVERVRLDLPVPLARAVLLPGGRACAPAVVDLIKHLSTGVSDASAGADVRQSS